MTPSIQSILISESQLQGRVRELGRQISEDYKDRDLVLLCVLKGAVVFLADLIRVLSIPVRCEFIQLNSYGNKTEPSHEIRVIQRLNDSLCQSDVLIVEDIVDTGGTLSFLMTQVKALKPATLKVCSLLDKPARRRKDTVIDYVGFEIPDTFVVGYGLDYAQKYRNLPYIAILDLA
ncbi:MAG: hypoxanthine phosphoribosyltransferase [Candidatus Poribacteria bacterium]|nr:hypoxanthine phosphoribosyltransferase [Candidatus Poribacteria bacterium]